MPRTTCKQPNPLILDNAIVAGEIDFLHHSKYSVPSMEQPGHGAYVLAAAEKWTYDTRLLSTINTECKHFGLPTMPTLDNTRARIIVALFSHAFIASCDSHDKFKSILDKICERLNIIKLDEDFINSHDMSQFYPSSICRSHDCFIHIIYCNYCHCKGYWANYGCSILLTQTVKQIYVINRN